MKFDGDRHWPWLAGFFLAANLYLIPSLASSPRVTDLAGAALALWLLQRLAAGRQAPGLLAMAGVAALSPVIWLFFSWLGKDMVTGVLAVRWLLALPFGLALALLITEERKLISLAWGLVAGCLVNILVVVAQWVGLEYYLQFLGLSSVGANYHTWVGSTVRFPGLHGQHNASVSVISLIIPAGFFLYFNGRLRMGYLLGLLLGFLLAVHLTSTRGPLVVALLSVGFLFMLARRFARSIVIGFVLASLVVPLLVVYGPPGGWARWKNKEAMGSNASERVETTLGAVELAAENPLGLGAVEGRERLTDRTGIGATHNAFLQTALMFGTFQAVILLLGFLVALARSLGGADHPFFLPGAMAFQVAGLFMFEEHLNNPTFMVLAAWLILAMAVRADGTKDAAA